VKSVVLATFLLLPRAVSAHHFMGDQLPQTLTQDAQAAGIKVQ
jgi:hypothetical protein